MTRHSNEKMTVGDVEVSVTTDGPEELSERVHMHVINEAAKAMQAVDRGEHPDDCEGQAFGVDWSENNE